MPQTTPEQTVVGVDKNGRRVRAMFAGVAKRYDLLNHLLSLNIDRRWRRFVLRTVPARSDQAVLDICTGTGDLALGYAAAPGGSVRVVGADFCHEMLVLAKEKSTALGRDIEFVEADAQALPFPDGTFDITCVAFGLRNVSDTRAGLAEMMRVTRHGGTVAVLEFSRPRLPVLRAIYLFYFRHVLPRIGQAISRSRHDAYHYLPASVLDFPDGEAMLDLLGDTGLADAVAHPITFGIATLYVARKPANEQLSAGTSALESSLREGDGNG